MIRSSFEEILQGEFKKYSNKRILTAFSGGKDSLSLIDFLNKKKDEYNIFVSACYVNHGLRDTAKRDEDFCRNYCYKNGINFYVENIGINILSDKSNSVEAVARKYRYERLLNILERDNFDYIFTAHTFSDNVENFFVDLYTGVSIFTFGGIFYNNNKVIRPMLDITTEMVNDYLLRNKLEPVYDETNSDNKYVRNRVRNKLIPVLYDCGRDFESSVLKIQHDSKRLYEYFYNKTKSVVMEETEPILIDRCLFRELEVIEKEYLLGRLFSPLFRMSKGLIFEVLKFLDGNMSKRLDLPNGYVLEQSFDSIRIFNKSYVEPFLLVKNKGESEVRLNNTVIIFKDDYIDMELTVRNRRNGDRFKNRKLKDILIDKHIDLFDRDRLIIIECDNRIIWVEKISSDNMKIEVIR